MEIHLVFLRAAFPRGFPRKFARCDSGTRDSIRSRGLRGYPRGRRRIKGPPPPLILRPKRLPSVDYSNVALLQLAIRSLQLHAIRDIAVESDAFCLDGHYRVSTLSMRIYMAECLMRWDRRFRPGHAINRELIKLAAIVLGNCWNRDRSVNRKGNDSK